MKTQKSKLGAGSGLKCVWVRTSYGKFLLKGSEKGLYGLEFPSQNPKSQAKPAVHDSDPSLKKAAKLLGNYLKGESTSFKEVPIDMSDFTKFERKVLQALANVNWGKVRSYGELAEQAGFPGAARAVGSVMRKNRLPIILPCHRILRSQGKLGGYSQGLNWKRRLLSLEGVSPKQKP